MSPLPHISAVTAFLLCMGASAQAQYPGFFGTQGPFLDKADLVQADLAARCLLGPRPAALGTSTAWAEPTSGNSGVLTMHSAYQRHGRECRTVQWHDDFKSDAERTLLLDTCLVEGRWKLM